MAWKLDGKARLDRKIRDMPEAVRLEISTALEAGMNDMTGYMRRLAHASWRTGELAGSIGWSWAKAGTEGLEGLKPGRAVNIGKKGELQLAAKAYAGRTPSGEAYWAKYIEFGTRKMRPKPFFFPAYRLKKRDIKRNMALASRRAIKKIAKAGSP